MKNGYSLIEILVVLMIISIFSTIIIDYGRQKSDRDLLFATRQVAEDIRVVQSSTINTLKFNGSIPLGGYGIKFSAASNAEYILFADIDGDMRYTSGTDGDIKTAALPYGILIDSVETNIPSSADANIVFIPPYGIIFINEKNSSNSGIGTVVLNLRLKKASSVCPSSDCRVLEFNSEGKISK